MSNHTITGRGLFTGTESSVTFVGPRQGLWIRSEEHDAGCACVLGAVDPSPRLIGVPAGFPVRNTTLRTGNTYIATVEHLLGACAGLNIWNAQINLRGPEIPIDDGSAMCFVNLLQRMLGAGELRTGYAEPIMLRSPVRVAAPNNPDINIIAEPGTCIEYTYNLRYPASSGLAHQTATWKGDHADFAHRVSRARTFSFAHEAQAARAAGLFERFTPKDLPVVENNGELIDNTWRIPEEAATHKLLDLIGDLALLGAPLIAKITATGSGHALTHAFSREVRNSLR